MYKKQLQKTKWFKFLAIFILFAIFFVCKGVGINTILHSGMSHGIMPCCDVDESMVAFGNSMDKLVAPIPTVVTLFAILFVIFIVLSRSFFVEYKTEIYWYDFWLRRRVGSTHMYNFLNRLLSLGILQPKLF